MKCVTSVAGQVQPVDERLLVDVRGGAALGFEHRSAGSGVRGWAPDQGPEGVVVPLRHFRVIAFKKNDSNFRGSLHNVYKFDFPICNNFYSLPSLWYSAEYPRSLWGCKIYILYL